MESNNNSPWLRYRFYIKKADCQDDERPVKWPPVGPYWSTGQGDDYLILVAYVKHEDQIKEFWPEAYNLDLCKTEQEITFYGRFPKPDWWNE